MPRKRKEKKKEDIAQRKLNDFLSFNYYAKQIEELTFNQIKKVNFKNIGKRMRLIK